MKNKILLFNKLPNIMLLVVIDIIILFVTSFLSVLIRFDFGNIPDIYLLNSYKYIFVDSLILILIFSIFKLYTSIWKYASVPELLSIIFGSVFTETIFYIYKNSLNVSLPKSYYLIQLILLIMFFSFTRLGYRVIRLFYVYIINKKNKVKVNTMLIGAGSAGKLIIDEVYNNKDFDSLIVCAIDDDRSKVNSYIKGVKVCGTTKNIVEMVEKYAVQDIIIAIPSASKTRIDKIVNECQKTKCNIKILPSIYSSMNGGLSRNGVINKIRPLSYEDFLGRDQIVVNDQEISDSLENQVVLVTGGGGSIGSELCRQIAKCNPKKLIVFDIYENNAYEIQQELFRNYPQLDLHTIIGSVRDYDRLEKVFKEFNIDRVYHAAAHKHVPLMEVSPNEAIKNNCLGTLNTCKLADKYKVKKFVLISTDKAVRPTNVMGASKRICEMIIQTYDKKSENTDYVAVRFGNVLGSNGSVIPLFLKQIDNGGPVTVTHREMRRFFMTIPEAVSLVLQAGCYAKGGEIFVLDMGKPVKIYDLACKLIRYKGFEPEVDIPIKITGLRPGEKLYEEILMDEEGLESTPNKLIHIGKPIKISNTFLEDLDELIKSAYKNQDDIKDKVAVIVDTYTIDKERVGK